MIYEDVAENTFDQNNQDSKISENETNEILATDHEELLKPLETPGATDSIVTTGNLSALCHYNFKQGLIIFDTRGRYLFKFERVIVLFE